MLSARTSSPSSRMDLRGHARRRALRSVGVMTAAALVLYASLAPLIGLSVAGAFYALLRTGHFPWVSRFFIRAMPLRVRIPAHLALLLCAVFLAAFDISIDGYPSAGCVAAVGVVGMLAFPYTSPRLRVAHLVFTDIFFTGALARLGLIVHALDWPYWPSVALWIALALVGAFLGLALKISFESRRSIVDVRTSDEDSETKLRVLEVFVILGLIGAGLTIWWATV